jgi:hypothetical protein
VSKVDHKIMIKNKLRINRFFLFLLKIFNKKSILFIFLTLHLVIGLKSIDFCLFKQQECKGIYDKNYRCEVIIFILKKNINKSQFL